MKKLLCVFVAYIIFCISTLFHEWTHSLAAVIFSVKKNVFDIKYSYLPFLMGISEKVDYTQVEQLPAWQAIFISAAGLMSNGILAVISLIAIKFCKKPITTLVCYGFAFFNISDWVNYCTIRTVFPRGDIAHMMQYGVNNMILLVCGALTSILLLYLLFGPALQQTNNICFNQHEDKKSFLRTALIVFVCMQAGELYNDLAMY